MRKRIAFFLTCLLMAGLAVAQTTKVTGTVISVEDGEPIPGASVLIEGTKTGVVTNSEGKFALTVPISAKRLEISCAGMIKQLVRVKPVINVELQTDSKALDEVMVVAFGQQTRESFTGSATVVTAEDLSKKTGSNVLNAIVGEVPGLQMRGMSGAPGAGSGSINIRGLSSLYADTEPLIIVDGAPYYASLTNIAPDDIESVTVLKDAASAALYGAAGAAGVILVTTKKGKTKDAVVNANMSWGMNSRAIQDYKTIQDPGQYYETYYSMLNNYYLNQGNDAVTANATANATMMNRLGYNIYTVPEGQNLIGMNGKLNPRATLGRAYVGSDGETYWLQPDNWTDMAYSTALRQEYNVNVSAGSSQGSFFASAGYLKEDGIIEYSDYERFNARLKADYQAKKWLKVGANVGYTHSNTTSNPNMSTEWGSTNLMYFTSYVAPIYPVFVRTLDANGVPVIRTDQYGNPQYDYGVPATNYPDIPNRGFLSTGNPLGANRYNSTKNESHQLNQTYTADIRFTNWLSFNSTNNLNISSSNSHYYGNPYYGNTASENGNLQKNNYTYFRQDYIQTLMFHKLFGQHDLQAQLGHEYNKTNTKYLAAIARGGFSPDVQELSAFDDRYNSASSTSKFNREGYFINVLYDFNKKYFASANFRRDASSYFDKDHRWGNFWSVGGAWMINKEKFFKASWVDALKLKASIGQQGNDNIGSFYYTNLYSLSQTGQKSMSPTFSSLGNPDITWETTLNANVGIEFDLWHGRLTGGLDFYNKKISDLLFWISIPEATNGVRGYYGNIGDIRNRGVELTLSADLIRKQNFTWNFGLNLAHNRTKILKLPEFKTRENGGFAETSNWGIYSWLEEGKAMNNAFLYKYAGVYNEQTYALTGDATYDPTKGGLAMYWVDEDMIDANGGAITSRPGKKHSYTTTKTSDASRYEMGSTLPKVSGGFNTTLKIYDFDINATFDYQIGGRVFDSSYQSLMSPETGSSVSARTFHKDVLDAWSPTNPNSDIPRWNYNDEYTAAASSRFLTKASYLNFQSFSVGYTLPKNLTRKIHIEKIRLYCQGQNLYFWSVRKGFDPRYSFGSTADTNVYSPVRTVTWGLQVTF